MKRYLLFFGDNYYPLGGWGDFQGDFDCVELAKDYLLKKDKYDSFDWAQVIDTETKAIVWNNKEGFVLTK